MDKIIAVTSGKGGVGKTSVSLNLAIALSQAGRKVCVLDADLGLANINILLGAQPKLTFYHLLYEGATLDDVMFEGPSGIKVIPGVSGIQELTQVDESMYAPLMYQFHDLDQYDFLIVDTAAGIAAANVAFSRAADSVIVVLTPEPTSMTDGFAIIKILTNNQYAGDLRILPNMFESERAAEKSCKRIDEAARKFLNRAIEWLPPLLRDPTVGKAVVNQKPFMATSPQSKASECMRKISAKVNKWSSGEDTVRAADFIKNVIKYANDNELAELVEKYNIKAAQKRKEKEQKEQAPEQQAAATPQQPAQSPRPSQGPDTNIAAALLETQNNLAKIFQNNIAIQQKMLEALTALYDGSNNSKVNGANEEVVEHGERAAKPPVVPANSAKISKMTLDIDEFIKDSGASGEKRG